MTKKKRRIWLRVVLIALGVITLSIGALAVWQQDNINAFMASRQHSSEELAQQLEDNEARTAAILDRLPLVSFRPLTDDEKAKLSSGELTENEAAALMIVAGGSSSGNNTSGDITDRTTDITIEESADITIEESAVPTAKPPTEVEQKVSEQIARIYVLRDVMTAKLDSLLSRAKAEYSAIPSQGRTNAKKQEIGAKYLLEAQSMEAGCDAQMDTILKDLTKILKDYGGDTGIVSEIRKVYKDEKVTKKSYYLSKYM
ncbi:hypothetical protein FACS1894127_4800 [Clostridia bacterium]|nr:hypothetical protein FACS1894127_4800 [Clostridia bacterium]